MKKCAIYETLGSVNEMKTSKKDGLMTLSGVFGECGVRNRNHRVYEKSNYGKMVAEMKQRIQKNGAVPGELEHPAGMNINLENISHKITSIDIDENGLVTGTIQLLDTPKGKIAQAIVEGGLPLFISSRASGQVDKNGNVTLEQLSTFDLVGEPGCSKAQMFLNESQVCESVSENCYIISEKTDNTDMTDTDRDMLLEKIEELEARVEELNDQLDEAKGDKINLASLADGIQKWIVEEYSPEVQKWIVNEFAEEHKDDILAEAKDNTIDTFINTIAPKIQEWIVEHYSPEVQKWIVEHYSPEVQKWIVEHYSPEVQKWIVEHYSPEVQNWMVNEFAPKIQEWIVEHYSPEVQKWLETEYTPETRSSKLSSIDETLALLESMDVKKPTYKGRQINETLDEPLYIANMPETARVKYNMASQEVKESIARRAKIYDFSHENAINEFWNGVNFDEIKPAPNIYEGLDNIMDKRERELRMSFRRRRAGL